MIPVGTRPLAAWVFPPGSYEEGAVAKNPSSAGAFAATFRAPAANEPSRTKREFSLSADAPEGPAAPGKPDSDFVDSPFGSILSSSIAFGLFFLNSSTTRRIPAIGLVMLGAGILGGSILIFRNLWNSIVGMSPSPPKKNWDRSFRPKKAARLSGRSLERSLKAQTAKRVIICTTNFQQGTFVVSHQGGEPFEVSFHNSSSRRMTRDDWEGVFPGIAPPDDLSQQVKIVFGNGRYYSYIGSYFEVLNETSCPFSGWADAVTSDTVEEETVSSEPPVVQNYEDLISFLDSRGVYYGGGDTEDGGKSVSISVEQEWADGMIPDDDPRKVINTVTYFFNEDDDLAGVELYLWAPRLLDFVNEDVPDSSLILSIENLQEHSISVMYRSVCKKV